MLRVVTTRVFTLDFVMALIAEVNRRMSQAVPKVKEQIADVEQVIGNLLDLAGLLSAASAGPRIAEREAERAQLQVRLRTLELQREVLRKLTEGPVLLTQRGHGTAILLDVEMWNRLTQEFENLQDALDIIEARQHPEPSVALDAYFAGRSDSRYPIKYAESITGWLGYRLHSTRRLAGCRLSPRNRQRMRCNYPPLAPV